MTPDPALVDSPATPPVVAIQPALEERLRLSVQDAIAVAQQLQVMDLDSYQIADEAATRIKQAEREAEAYWRNPIDQAYQLHRSLCAKKNDMVTRLQRAYRALCDRMLAWKSEEEQKARAVAEAEAERLRQLDQARLLREAEALHRQGDSVIAEHVLTQAADLPLPVVLPVPAVPKDAGTRVTYRTDWKWRPVGGDTPDNRARLRDLLPREYLCSDDVKINGVVARLKDAARIPGIEVYSVQVPVSRR